jgi:hypothetical protein
LPFDFHAKKSLSLCVRPPPSYDAYSRRKAAEYLDSNGLRTGEEQVTVARIIAIGGGIGGGGPGGSTESALGTDPGESVLFFFLFFFFLFTCFVCFFV